MMALKRGRHLLLLKPVVLQTLLVSWLQYFGKLTSSYKTHRFGVTYSHSSEAVYKSISIENSDMLLFIHRSVKTILNMKVTTAMHQKVHGHFHRQIMDGLYLIVLPKHSM